MNEYPDLSLFLQNLWLRENDIGLKAIEGKGGYSNGKYYPYKTANGNIDVGPGFDMEKQTPEFRKRAAEGFTKEELDNMVLDIARNELPYFRKRIIREGGNPDKVTDAVYNGLLDMYWQLKNGLYGYDKFWRAVASGDYEGMRNESATYYLPKNGNIPKDAIVKDGKILDTGRWDFRKNNYFKDPETLNNIVNDAVVQTSPIMEPAFDRSIYVEQPNVIRDYKPVVFPSDTRMDVRKGMQGKIDFNNFMDSIRIQNNLQTYNPPIQFNNGEATESNQYDKGGSLKFPQWDNLSVKEKADVMKVAISNGITNLSDIKQRYNTFAEGGDIEPEKYYAIMEKVAEENNAEWNRDRIKEGGRPLTVDEDLVRILNDNDYDYRGYYNKYPNGDGNAIDHWTDEFKTAYHPTFSDQSIYSGKKSQFNPYGLPGGFWAGDSFVPRAWQVNESNRFDIGGPTDEKPVRKYPHLDLNLYPASQRLRVARTNARIKNIADKVYDAKDWVSDKYNYAKALFTGIPMSVQEARMNLYKNINPNWDYENPIGRVFKAITDTGKDKMWNRGPIADEAFATYLQIPEENRNYKTRFQKSEYRPTKGNTVGEVYKLPLKNDENDKGRIVEQASNLNLNTSAQANILPSTGNDVLGDYTISKGYDNNGEYVSYYDEYDLNPYKGFFAERAHNDNTPEFIKNIGDFSFGLGKPFTFYDRIYLDDYYGVPDQYKGGFYLPELTVKGKMKALGGNLFANGGIHIKPSHRGRLTKLKKRTGKTESELYNDGNPAHKKMVVFARNARKWHDLGGNLYVKGGPKKLSNPLIDQAMKYFMNKGLTDYQAAGIVGNLMRESSMNSDAVNKSSGAYGLLQWLGPRKKNLFKMYGEHPTFDQQLDYLWHELNTTHRKGLNLVLASPDASTAADKFFGNGAFLAGTERAIEEMNKYGQDGEGALKKGIDFAYNILGKEPEPELGPEQHLTYVPMGAMTYDNNLYQSPSTTIQAFNPQLDSSIQENREARQAFNFLNGYNNLRNVLSLLGETI